MQENSAISGWPWNTILEWNSSHWNRIRIAASSTRCQQNLLLSRNWFLFGWNEWAAVLNEIRACDIGWSVGSTPHSSFVLILCHLELKTGVEKQHTYVRANGFVLEIRWFSGYYRYFTSHHGTLCKQKLLYLFPLSSLMSTGGLCAGIPMGYLS